MHAEIIWIGYYLQTATEIKKGNVVSCVAWIWNTMLKTILNSGKNTEHP